VANLPTDADTMARLLAGLVHPDDAPPGYQEIAQRAHAAQSSAEAASSAREHRALKAMVAAAAAPPDVHQAGRPRRRAATGVAVAVVVTIAVIASAPAGALTVVRRAFDALPGIQRSTTPERPAAPQPPTSLVGHRNGDPSASEPPGGVWQRRNRALPEEDRHQAADAPNAKPAPSGSTNSPSANANPKATDKQNPNKPADATKSAKPAANPSANAPANAHGNNPTAQQNNAPPPAAAHETGPPADNAERGQGHANREPKRSTPNPKP
jgi:hypothetical protein